MDEKETVLMTMRVPASLKKAFDTACKLADTTASREIRNAMREYVREHGQLEFESKKGKKKA